MRISKKQILLIVFVLIAGLVFTVRAGGRNALAPTQFEVIGGVPYCVTEGVLYRREGTGWSKAGYSESIRQLTPGEELCAVDMDGNVIFEGDLSQEVLPLMSGYYQAMAREFLDINQTEPFLEISGNVMSGASALLENGSILRPKGSHYEKLAVNEKPIMLSDNFILTEKGNIYMQGNLMGKEDESDLYCIYDGGDITAISGYQFTGECLGVTKSGTVLSWNTSGNTSFDIPSVSEWADVVMVKQGHHFAVALTKSGKVLYADSDAETTERIGNELAEWRDITNISVSGMTVYGLGANGDCLSMEIVFS